MAANADPTSATVIVAHQGAAVVAAAATLSAADETPTDAVAAASCNSTIFGMAYGLSGGDIAFRTMDVSATLGAERVITTGFGTDVTAISLAAVEGGVLLAAGTPSQIAVFAVPCP